MERKIRKRCKRARASWGRAAVKSAKAETSKRRSVAFVALVLAALATSGRVAGIASGAEPPLRPVVTMEDAHRCAFRVVASSNGSTATQVGSGTTIARLKNEWLGATNAHVVDGCGVFAMQYFGDGRPVCVDAKLVGKWRDSARGLDFALLAASRSALDAYNPPVAPLAPPERARLDAASPILSVGCPEAREPQAWKGRVTGQFGEVRQFKPAPLQGQSGSGILQFSPETGVYETRALVTYRTDPSALRDSDFDSAEGGALEFALLYDALNGGGAKGSGGGRSGSNGGVPIPRPRTSALGLAVNSARLPFVPCVATTPGGFETALWRSSDAEAKTAAQTSETPSAETATKPLLLYFRSDDCAPCRSTTPLVEEFARKGWPVRILNIGDAEGGRAWRAYGFRLVPAFAFVELDASGEWFATLDLWTGGADARRRIERNFAAFKSRDPTRPRPNLERSTTQAGPKFVPCVATVDSEETAETAKTETPSKNDLTNGAEEPEEGADAAPTFVAETVAAEPGDGPTFPVELEEARLPAVAVGGEFGPDFEPSTAAEALEAFASGWSPFRPGAGGVPESGGGSDDVGGSTDSTAGLIGGAVERAAREKVEALAAELEKAARERIDAVAGELESAARAKAEALAAEVEEAARAKVGELESAARLKLDAAAGAVETAATAKLETAVDGLKRRAGAALAAVGVWGAFAAGAWYWLVRGLAKCWGSAPKYRLVRDEGTSQASTAGSD